MWRLVEMLEDKAGGREDRTLPAHVGAVKKTCACGTCEYRVGWDGSRLSPASFLGRKKISFVSHKY